MENSYTNREPMTLLAAAAELDRLEAWQGSLRRPSGSATWEVELCGVGWDPTMLKGATAEDAVRTAITVAYHRRRGHAVVIETVSYTHGGVAC